MNLPSAMIPSTTGDSSPPQPDSAAPVSGERTDGAATTRERRVAFLGRWGIALLGLSVSLIITGRAHWYFIRPFATPVNMDEGYCSAMGLRMIHGHWLPYVDGVSQRGPILYWLYALSLKLGGEFSWTSVRTTGMLLGFAAIALCFALGAVLFSPVAGGIAALVCTYFLTYELAPWDGIGFNGETVALPFALGAALCVAVLQLRNPARRTRWLLGAGALVACAGLSKQMFLIQGLPVGLWVLLGPQSAAPVPFRARFREAVTLMGGFAVPYALVLGLYAATGHLREFLYYYQSYGRQIFMDPVTVEFVRDKVREQIDKYFIGIAGVSALWFFAVARALRQTLGHPIAAAPDGPSVATYRDAGGERATDAEMPFSPEGAVALNLIVPGLGLALVPRRRIHGAVVFVAVTALLIVRALARRQLGVGYTPAAITRDVAIWIASGIGAAVLTGALIAAAYPAHPWRGLARVRAHAPAWFAIAQMLCAACGAIFTFRFFPHYFVQLFPFAAVLIGSVVAASFEKLDATDKPGQASAFVLITGATILLAVGSSALQRNVRIRRDTDRWYQDPHADPIARYVAEHTQPGQKIFVWGFRAETYVSARRLPGSRFVYSVYPAGVVPWFQSTHEEEERRVVPGSRQQLLDDLEAERPELVVDAGRSMNGRYMYNYPQLRVYLDRNYCFMRYVDGEPVYRRRHGEHCPPADY